MSKSKLGISAFDLNIHIDIYLDVGGILTKKWEWFIHNSL